MQAKPGRLTSISQRNDQSLRLKDPENAPKRGFAAAKCTERLQARQKIQA